MRTRGVHSILFALGAVALGGCPAKSPPAPPENRNPYRNVTPQKVKEKVEQIEQKEDERNERKLKELEK